jgi:hypothetical protein
MPVQGEQSILLLAGTANNLTFVNATNGCTPGFWQGGSGSQLWDVAMDPDWSSSGGQGNNPYTHNTLFNDIFEAYSEMPADITMYDLVSTGGAAHDWQKAARNVVAAYLNASWGMAFPYTTDEVSQLWTDAVNGDRVFLEVHNLLGAANSPMDGFCPIGK